MKQNVRLITAAGGNATAIEVIERPLSRTQYEQRGAEIGRDLAAAGAEQTGFLIIGTNHFEMAGGEFCGNATCAAGAMIFEAGGRRRFGYSVSGFRSEVRATVGEIAAGAYDVRCEFPGMRMTVDEVVLDGGRRAHVVDLDGIVHVVVEGASPAACDPELHRRITARCGLQHRQAVGVVWCRSDDQGLIHIDPVVHVRAAGTLRHETACGSAAIAVAKVTGAQTVVQPTGQSLAVEIEADRVTLSSEMAVIR